MLRTVSCFMRAMLVPGGRCGHLLCSAQASVASRSVAHLDGHSAGSSFTFKGRHGLGAFSRQGARRRFGYGSDFADGNSVGGSFADVVRTTKGKRLAFGGYEVRGVVKALSAHPDADPDGFHDNIVRGARVKYNDSSALKLRRRAYIQWEPGHPSKVLIVKKQKNAAASQQLKLIADWLQDQGLKVYVEPIVQATEFPEYRAFEAPTMEKCSSLMDSIASLSSEDSSSVASTSCYACGVPLAWRGSAPQNIGPAAPSYDARPLNAAEGCAVCSDGLLKASNMDSVRGPVAGPVMDGVPPHAAVVTARAAATALAQPPAALAHSVNGGQRPPPRQGTDVDFCITLGGDGTVLHLASMFERDEPLPPVISFAMGSLGFLTPFDVAEFKLRLGRVLSAMSGPGGGTEGGGNPLFCTLRTRKRCEVHHSGKLQCVYNVLNEMVIDRGASPAVAVLELFIDGNFVTTVEADGLIVASPSGSTAYSMSAGGPIIAPSVPCSIITPIAPLSLSFRPLVIPESSSILIHVPEHMRSHARASFDGKRPMRVRRDSCILVSTSLCPLPVINMGAMDSDWYDGVNKKLKWNQAMRPHPKLPTTGNGEAVPSGDAMSGWFGEQ